MKILFEKVRHFATRPSKKQIASTVAGFLYPGMHIDPMRQRLCIAALVALGNADSGTGPTNIYQVKLKRQDYVQALMFCNSIHEASTGEGKDAQMAALLWEDDPQGTLGLHRDVGLRVMKKMLMDSGYSPEDSEAVLNGKLDIDDARRIV